LSAAAADAPPVLPVAKLSATDRLVELPAIALRRASDGTAPRLPTALRAGLRGGALAIRFDGRDEGFVGTRTRHDDQLWLEDVYEVFLAPQDPPHVYYEFEVNPLGTTFDARIESPRLTRPTICVDVEWGCPGFRAKVRRRPGIWSASLSIPLGALAGAGPLPRKWRANFYRVDRGSPDEYSAWSPIYRDPPDFHDARRFGTLVLPE
jgi:hypothetical protein